MFVRVCPSLLFVFIFSLASPRSYIFLYFYLRAAFAACVVRALYVDSCTCVCERFKGRHREIQTVFNLEVSNYGQIIYISGYPFSPFLQLSLMTFKILKSFLFIISNG